MESLWKVPGKSRRKELPSHENRSVFLLLWRCRQVCRGGRSDPGQLAEPGSNHLAESSLLPDSSRSLLFLYLRRLGRVWLGAGGTVCTGPGWRPGHPIRVPAPTDAKYDEAFAERQKLSSARPAPKGLSRELGMAYYKKSDYAQAVVSLKQALEENPQDSEATQLLDLVSAGEC